MPTTTAFNLYDPGVACFGINPKYFPNANGNPSYINPNNIGSGQTVSYAVHGTGVLTSSRSIFGASSAYIVKKNGIDITVTVTGWNADDFADVTVPALVDGDYLEWIYQSGNGFAQCRASDGAIKVTSSTGTPSIGAASIYPGWDNSNTPTTGWHKLTMAETVIQYSLGSTIGQIGSVDPVSAALSDMGTAFKITGATTIKCYAKARINLNQDGINISMQGTDGTWGIRTWSGLSPGATYILETVADSLPVSDIYTDGTFGVSPALPRMFWTGTSFDSGVGTPAGFDNNLWNYPSVIAHSIGYLLTNAGQSGSSLESNVVNAQILAGTWDTATNPNIGLPISDASIPIMISAPINNVWLEDGSANYPLLAGYLTDLANFLTTMRTKFPLSKILVALYPVTIAIGSTGGAAYNTGITNTFNTWADPNSVLLSGWSSKLAVSGDLVGSHPTQQGSDELVAYLSPFLALAPPAVVNVTSVIQDPAAPNDTFIRMTFSSDVSSVSTVSGIEVSHDNSYWSSSLVQVTNVAGHANQLDLGFDDVLLLFPIRYWRTVSATGIVFANSGIIADASGSVATPTRFMRNRNRPLNRHRFGE